MNKLNTPADPTKAAQNKLNVGGVFTVECFKPNGQLRWAEEFHNLVVNEGLDYALDSAIAGQAQIATWYLGLTDLSPIPAATDTMAVHPGWTENTDYSEGTRQQFITPAALNQLLTNTASKATFTANASGILGGAFLTSDNTKGGTVGTLFSCEAFTGGNRPVNSGDTVNVTYELAAADA